MEGYFLGESLDINEQITGISDVFIFVMEVVGIPGLYGNREFCGGEVMLFDEVLIYARNVCTTINQCLGIDNFH